MRFWRCPHVPLLVPPALPTPFACELIEQKVREALPVNRAVL